VSHSPPRAMIDERVNVNVNENVNENENEIGDGWEWESGGARVDERQEG
jgi:hypothetical protein